MRTVERIAPTRMNSLRVAKRLDRIQKGIALLRRKREALVSEFFRRARPAAEARNRITAQARRAYPALVRALAVDESSGLEPLGWPGREIKVELRPAQIWGLAVSEIVSQPEIRRTLEARGTAPGFTGPAASDTAREFETLVALLLGAAAEDMVLRRLGDELARTSRQLNTLQYRLAPEIRALLASIRSVLGEREREEQFRARFLGAP